MEKQAKGTVTPLPQGNKEEMVQTTKAKGKSEVAETKVAAVSTPQPETKPANFIYYGDNSQVNALKHWDYNDYLKLTEKKQDLPGFDEEYNDIVDYILKITHRIWEERSIGVIYDTYHNNTLVHTCSALNSGVIPVVASTLAHLHAFPDRRIVAESVIWSEDAPGIFFTSHRSKSGATNLGDSEFGPVTGRKVQFRAIADCLMSENRIYEEWLVRDNIWLVQQLGLDPYEVARRLAEKYVAAGSPAFHGNFGMPEAMAGQFYPTPYVAADDSVGELMREIHSAIFSCKLIDRVADYFTPQCEVHFIGNKNLVGKEEIQGTIISFLSSFPNAYFMIDRITCNEGEVAGQWEIALRWKMKGLHEGQGLFGKPSGQPVNIMGINHYQVVDGKIDEAWIMFDGIDVLRQMVVLDEDASACDDESVVVSLKA